MHELIISQSLSLLTDADFLDLAFEPEFMRERTLLRSNCFGGSRPRAAPLSWRVRVSGG